MAIYSGFSHKKIVIFHSYVKLPEGTSICHSSVPKLPKPWAIHNASIAQEGNSGRPVRPGAPSKLLRNLETCAEMEHATQRKAPGNMWAYGCQYSY
jgi:hypothetical protein